MKALKIAAIVALIYVGIVTAFESFLGYLQPTDGSTLVITTFDRDGTPHDRVVSRIRTDGQLYVARPTTGPARGTAVRSRIRTSRSRWVARSATIAPSPSRERNMTASTARAASVWESGS